MFIICKNIIKCINSKKEKIYIIYTRFWKYYFKIVHIFILIIDIVVRYIDVSICDSIVRQ